MKVLGLIVGIVGLVVALVFVLADVTGFGANPERFGMRQVTGTVIGLAVFGIGMVLYARGRRG